MDNQQDNKIYELQTNELQSNPLQPRGVITPDSLTDLVESIREQGILEPIVVAKTPAPAVHGAVLCIGGISKLER